MFVDALASAGADWPTCAILHNHYNNVNPQDLEGSVQIGWARVRPRLNPFT